MNTKQIKQYMLDCLVSGEHVDDAGEVILTQLAEDAASLFDLYDDNDDIPEEVFELAFQVAQTWEKMTA